MKVQNIFKTFNEHLKIPVNYAKSKVRNAQRIDVHSTVFENFKQPVKKQINEIRIQGVT